MSSKLAYEEFRLVLIRKLTEWFPNNSVIFDHQPETGVGGTSNVNSETWLAIQTLPPKDSKLGYHFVDVNKKAYKGSFRVDVLLRFYGTGAIAMLLELRDKIMLSNSPFSPSVLLGEGSATDGTTFLTARWERRANTVLDFSVCYEIVNSSTIKLIDKIESSGRLIEADDSELELIFTEI